MAERERALDHKCPGCGGKLLFNPEIGKWKCEYCSNEYTLEELQKYNNASSEENNKETETKENVEYVEYHCKNCGAEIIADDQTASTFCVYCGNTAILKSKLSGKFAPSKIIPFKKSKKDALKAFKGLYKGRPLMPKFFNDEKNIEKISGVYIPFWLFNITSTRKSEGFGEHITQSKFGDRVTVTTRKFEVKRDFDITFKGIPVDGSTRFADDIMNTIEPFKYEEMVPYNHAYLSGFLAEKYDVESEKTEVIAKARAKASTEMALTSSLSTYQKYVPKVSEYSDKVDSVEYVLLPVWMVNVKYMNKYYTFAMNAQTGEFVGNIPVDKKKALIIGSCVFIGVALIFIFIMFILNMVVD